MDDVGIHLRAAYPQALATLLRLLGSVERAEDALQEASLRALSHWRERGVPDLPAAWLVRTARNYTIDLYRKDDLQEKHAGSLADLHTHGRATTMDSEALQPVKDDLLRLVFTCCHPDIPEEDQVILVLKTLGGLATSEIASAFLVSEHAMEQRITRAKRRIRTEAIPYVEPEAHELADRLQSVMASIYLIFNEGYKAAQGTDVIRTSLAKEAIRVGRLLNELFRGEPEVMGLLALMLLHHARQSARLDEAGDMISLDQQDRSVWDSSLIAEGRAMLDKALRLRQPGAYQIQAAIAAVHVTAPSFAETDWAEIATLYRLLERHAPSPVITLNRAVAVSHTDGAGPALEILASIESIRHMETYHHFFAVLATLRVQVGDLIGAQNAYRRALDLVTNDRERTYLRHRLSEVEVGLEGKAAQ